MARESLPLKQEENRAKGEPQPIPWDDCISYLYGCFNRGFHYKPSILGYPYFWKHQYMNGSIFTMGES